MLVIKRFLLITLLSVFVGCGTTTGGHGGTTVGGSNDGAFDAQEKSYLYNLFLTEYYWNDTVPKQFDVTPYTEPQAMIDILKYSAVDRWSFAMTQQEYDNFSTQVTSGFGFGYIDGFLIYLTRINSPADRAGLQRGDRIVSINGSPVTAQLISDASNNLNVSTHFQVDRGGVPVGLDITAQQYSYNVSQYSIIYSSDGQKVGYFRLDSFTNNATIEIDQAFNYFKSQSIDKLVIDMRYNGGGAVNTASILLDKLAYDYNGQMQFKLVWNAENSANDEVYTFDSRDANSLKLDKLVFLTTSDSASASELVINAIEPYLGDRSSIVGTATHGKPVGMQGRVNQSYIYFLINFVIENSIGFYDYFNGLQPDCVVSDSDYSHQLGDPNEALLKEALYYIDNDHC